MDTSSFEQATLRARMLDASVPLYGLSEPPACKRWIAAVSSSGVAFGHQLEGSGVEIEVGSMRRSASKPIGQQGQAWDIRLNLARDVALEAGHPTKAALEQGTIDGDRLAADSDQWQATGVIVDEKEILGWQVHLNEHWGVYCEHGPGYLYARGGGGVPPNLKLKLVTATDLDVYIGGIENMLEEDDDTCSTV